MSSAVHTYIHSKSLTGRMLLSVLLATLLFTCIFFSFSTDRIHADAYIRLNNARKVAVAPDGTKVVITSWGEHALISQAINRNGLTRFAMASENVELVTNFLPEQGLGGTLTSQYLIGCQFPEPGATINAAFDLYPGDYILGVYPTPIINATGSATVSGSVYPTGVTMQPGYVQIISAASQDISNGSALIQVTDLELSLQANNQIAGQIASQGQESNGPGPCAGYVQARSYQHATMSTANYGLDVSLMGQPFGVG